MTGIVDGKTITPDRSDERAGEHKTPTAILSTGCRFARRDRYSAPWSSDDEAPALDELVFLLREFSEIEVVATARNGLEAVALIEQHEPDLVFLDVQMPGLDGLGVINKLAGGPGADAVVRAVHGV